MEQSYKEMFLSRNGLKIWSIDRRVICVRNRRLKLAKTKHYIQLSFLSLCLNEPGFGFLVQTRGKVTRS